MEDGSISNSPSASGRSGRSRGLEDFPWPPQADEGVPCDEFGFPLPPEKTDASDQDVEEIDPEDDAIEISSVSEIAALPDDFQLQTPSDEDGADDDEEGEAAGGESTQIESIVSIAPPLDVGSMADEFERALSEACSDDSAAKTLAEMPTVKPMPASDWPKALGKFRLRQAPLSMSAKPLSLSGNTSAGQGKSAAKSAVPPAALPEKQEKQDKGAPSISSAPPERRERRSEPAGAAFAGTPAPSAPAPASSQTPPKKPAADGEMETSALCLLKSDAAKAHYRRRLKPLTEGAGAREERRSGWASAALFGQELFATGRPVPARKVFERIISEGASEAFPFAMLGALHLSQGDDGEARKLFDQALRIDPGDVAALLGRAETFIRAAEPSLAMTDVRRALGQATFESSPLLPRAEAMMGVIQKLMRFLG